MEAGKINNKTLLLSFGILVLIETATKIVILHNYLHPLIALGIARLIQAVLFIKVILIRHHDLTFIGLAGHQILPGIKKGLLWSAAFGAVVCLVGGIFYVSGKNPAQLLNFPTPDRTAERIYLYIVAGLLAPVTEEIFFRGILYNFLRRWGIPAALSLSTLFFVLPHLTGTEVPVIQLVGGILFAAAYEIEKMLTAPIIIHVLGNLALMTLSFLF